MRKASDWILLDGFRDLEEGEIGKHFGRRKKFCGMTVKRGEV
jgi:hypothetical protein